MMNDLNFDLQRFTDLGKNNTVTVGNLTLAAGKANSISYGQIKYGSGSAVVITLKSASDEFSIKESDSASYVTYMLSASSTVTTNGDGIAFTIGAGSAIIGNIDYGEAFIVGSDGYSMKGTALLAGTTLNADKIYDHFSDTSIKLVNNTLSSTDLSTNWDKILEVDNDILSIADASIFTDAQDYKGLIALDTDTTDIRKYASLATDATNSNEYIIAAIDGASSLKQISLSKELMSVATGGIDIYKEFAGSTSSPVIVVDQTSLRASDISSNYFNLLGGYNSDSPVSATNAKTVSLIGGTVTATQDQTVKASKYTLSAYGDSVKAYDGIAIYSDINGDVTLGDIDVGESFFLQNSSGSSANYTMTAAGLIKEGETRPRVYNGEVLKTKALSASAIFNSSLYADSLYLNATDVIISIKGTGDANNPTLISYNNSAIATLSWNSSSSYFVLDSDDVISTLSPGDWKGISLGTDAKVSLSNEFTGEGTSSGPLKIMREGSTFGITNFKNTNLNFVTLGGGETTLNDSSISGVYLMDGSINTNRNQIFTVKSAGDIVIVPNNDYPYALINSSVGSGATIKKAADTINPVYVAVGRGSMQLDNSPITIDTAGKTKLTTSFVLDASSSNSVSARQNTTSGSVAFIYGKNSGFAVTDLQNGEMFTLTSSGVTTTYQVQNSKLISYVGTDTVNRKIWYGNKNYDYTVSKETEYNLAGDSFKRIIASGGTLNISSVYSASNSTLSMASGADLPIFGVDGSNSINTATTYGTLFKTDTGFGLSRVTSDTDLTSVSITASLPVEFNGDFSNTSITTSIYDSSAYKQIALANVQSVTGDEFTVSIGTEHSVNVVNVAGASSLNLSAGTLFSNDYNQTVKAGSYSIRAASMSSADATTSADITVIMTSNATNPTIGDIENGESFYIDNAKYTRTTLGFIDENSQLYYPDTVSGTISDQYSPVAIKVNDLLNATAISLVAAESLSGTFYNKENSKVFSIGGSNNFNAMVVNDTNAANVSARYASLVPGDSNDYTLTTINDSTEGWDVNIISVVGAETNINYSLIDSNVIIVAAGSSAAFLVNSVNNGGNINVDGTSTFGLDSFGRSIDRDNFGSIKLSDRKNRRERAFFPNRADKRKSCLRRKY